jgi:DNA-binding winged helix-turn-helix (wHTH) protein
MPIAAPRLLRFGEFTLDLQRCALRRGAVPIDLRPRAFDVLRYLVENPGRVVGKEELIRVVWQGQAVTDDALVQSVRSARHAVSDTDHVIIQTVPRRGYLPSLSCQECRRPARCRCDHCRREDAARIEVKDAVQVVRDLDLWGQPSFWAYQAAFHRCPWCHHRQHLIPPFKRRDVSYTLRFEQHVLRSLIGSNEEEVARRLGIGGDRRVSIPWWLLSW